ncbi:hypothetical protein [Streptomyces sudanensis]|uniref:hypothetical protein n=1 Tax=Streptomyces sudanensis TaxID=436397 RepID=UPI0020CF2B16|nr:hypothetical protein [Streptomyces sudanensis]MCQ0002533.1 hypothetical protein [Streptomyces sudanensis]
MRSFDTSQGNRALRAQDFQVVEFPVTTEPDQTRQAGLVVEFQGRTSGIGG